MYCRDCNYDLRGCEISACPECGRVFDPNDPASYFTEPRPHPAQIGTQQVLIMLAAIAMFFISLLFLIEVQLYVMDIWFDTATGSLLRGVARGGAWWELVGIGKLLMPVQLLLFLGISLVIGIRTRSRLSQYFLGEFR